MEMMNMSVPAVPSFLERGATASRPSQPSAMLAIRAYFTLTVMLITGATGAQIQIVYSRVYTYLIGNSIEQFNVTIGVMLGAMGIGLFVQKLLLDALCEIFVVNELLLALLAGFAAIGTQWLFAVTGDDFAWMKLVQIFVAGFLIGMEIPLLMRINERFAKSLGHNMAETWSWDYIGGALGIFLGIFALRHDISVTDTSIYVGLGNLAVAVIALVFFWQSGLLKWRLSGLVLLVISIGVAVALVFSLINADSWSKAITQKLYENPIVTQEHTKYQEIVITKEETPGDPANPNIELFLNGNKQFSSIDEKIYHEHLVHPAMNAAAKRRHVLILGGGDGMALREVLKYPEVQDVTLVDLDPKMIELATKDPDLSDLNKGAFKDARVNPKGGRGVTDTGKTQEVMVETGTSSVTCEPNLKGGADCATKPELESVGTVDVFTVDADQFIGNSDKLYDVVIVDLPDPNSPELTKLYSMEFYQKVKRSLSPDGIVVVQATSPYHAREAYLCILRTMAAAGLGVVPYHANVPSFGDWGWVMGSPSLSSQALYDRVSSIEFPSSIRAKLKELDENVMRASLVFNKGELHSPYTAVSTVMNPVILKLYVDDGWKVE